MNNAFFHSTLISQIFLGAKSKHLRPTKSLKMSSLCLCLSSIDMLMTEQEEIRNSTNKLFSSRLHTQISRLSIKMIGVSKHKISKTVDQEFFNTGTLMGQNQGRTGQWCLGFKTAHSGASSNPRSAGQKGLFNSSHVQSLNIHAVESLYM